MQRRRGLHLRERMQVREGLRMKKKKIEIIAELAIIIASINFGLFISKTFNDYSLLNLIFTIVILIGAIWLKNKD